MMEHDYEKLGAFYLGRTVDPQSGSTTDETVLYDSLDLTTHGVIIGMTRSGRCRGVTRRGDGAAGAERHLRPHGRAGVAAVGHRP
jgi:hypothetical protein